MTSRPRPLVAGNWKMNGLRGSLAEVEAMAAACDAPLRAKIDLLVCPPATLVAGAALIAGGRLAIGGQDCHAKASGAHTGDVSARMLADAGASHVIVGHSERRADHGESDSVVKAKAEAALAAGLIAIVCVGETEAERKGGRTLEIVGGQIEGSLPQGATAANMVIAYEPVWAIGTGLTPTPADVAEVHAFIRQALVRRLGQDGAGVRILYGGSVKPSNAAELMAVANVDGALVGGASLTAKDFMGIAAAYR
ncbi:MAG: triose-phosphate isomerase [Beijerinckiaceae bacterium]|nr:triose-phosphate isomerase [Beijerinckiaceae bacterium]